MPTTAGGGRARVNQWFNNVVFASGVSSDTGSVGSADKTAIPLYQVELLSDRLKNRVVPRPRPEENRHPVRGVS